MKKQTKKQTKKQKKTNKQKTKIRPFHIKKKFCCNRNSKKIIIYENQFIQTVI